MRLFPALAVALAPALAAGGDGRVRIVTPEELAAALPSVSVLDARGAGSFRAGHVPGSRRVDWRDWTQEKPGTLSRLFGNPARWGKVPPADAALERRLGVLGLSNARPVVVVGAPGGWGEEGRIAWNLLYWGADDVALLEGGFPAWSASSARPVEKGDGNPVVPGDFVVHLRPDRRIEEPELKAALDAKSRPILDARTPEEWAGQKMAGQKRGGHLPGARLVPEKSLYRPDGRYVDAGELKRLVSLPDGAAVSPATYCVGGIRSALLALLLEARLGIRAANYDGSIWEWSADPSLPLTTDNR
jgi:thiosulfate/3-mercaptopyruvate sulfurtransferase